MCNYECCCYLVTEDVDDGDDCYDNSEDDYHEKYDNQ